LSGAGVSVYQGWCNGGAYMSDTVREKREDCVRVIERVCVCEWKREREREKNKKWGIERVCVWVWEREGQTDRERVCVCVCVGESEWVT